MSSKAKKLLLVSSYYLVAVFSLTIIVFNSPSVKNTAMSFFWFYLGSAFVALFLGYYLFHTNVADYHYKKGAIETPQKRDVSKRKVLAIAFFYSIFFLLMFLFEGIAFLTFITWPVMVFLTLLLLFDRRLIFNIPIKTKIPVGQKYGFRFLVASASLSSMWYLNEFIIRKPIPLRTSFLSGWEYLDISLWAFPIAVVTSLIAADWVTCAVHHIGKKDFLKRADVVLFLGIQILIIMFLIIV